MKVLLCQTPTGRREHTVFPLGLAYIAGSIRNHEVLCWDPKIGDAPIADLIATLEKFEPDLVGLALRNIDSVICSPGNPPRSYYEPFVSLVKLIKEKAPYAKLMVGGAGFSILSKEIMEKNPEIDFGVISEGEPAVPRLLENLDHPEKVKNIVARKNGKIIFSERENYVNFDSLPPPAREYFDVAKYGKNPFSMGLQTKRGCVFRCLYCPNPRIVGSVPRLRNPKRVVDEIQEIVNTYDVREFYFSDTVFNYPADHAMDICQEIIRRRLDIKWQADFRPDYMNFKLMKTAVESGCAQFNFSPDGTSDEAMQVLGKNMNVDCVTKTVQWASEIEGAKAGYCFVYDIPSGNMSQYRGLLKLSTKFLPYGRKKIRSFGLTRMRIYPNTPLYELAVRQRKIQPDTDLIEPVYYSHASETMAHTLCSLTTGYAEVIRKILFAD